MDDEEESKLVDVYRDKGTKTDAHPCVAYQHAPRYVFASSVGKW